MSNKLLQMLKFSENQNNYKTFKQMTKTKTYIMCLIVCLLSCFFSYSCTELSKIQDKKITVTYNVVGHHFEPASQHISSKRYVFCHNDKYGDITFKVTPKTYAQVEAGLKKISFTSTFNELYICADNKATKNRLSDNIADFGIDSKFWAKNANSMTTLNGFIFMGLICIMIIYGSYSYDAEEKIFSRFCFINAILVITTFIYVVFW